MTTQEIIAATLRMNDLARGYLKRAETAEVRCAALKALVWELRNELVDLMRLAECAMEEANGDGAGYDIDGEFAGSQELLARADKVFAGEPQEEK